MSDVTRILQSIDSGDPKAAEELLPLVYAELRRLAAAKMKHESSGQTLQPTALVHEAWLKLVGEQHDWRDRQHFISAAAEAMRRILVDRARRKQRQKRGGGNAPVELGLIDLPGPMEEETVLLVHEALERFSRIFPEKAEIVKMRYFVGLNNREIAQILGMSDKTVMRHWAFAKAWLCDSITDSTAGEV